MGRRLENLTEALRRMSESGIQILRCSSPYLSAPWGITDQEAFINAVCEVQFGRSPQRLLQMLLQIEQEMGRRRTVKWGPRLIDLDLIEFERIVIQSPELALPHPYYLERDFVMVPMLELVPDWVPTGREETLRSILQRLGPTEIRPLSPGERSEAWNGISRES